jgi:PST family polysaccharide transporter
MFFHFSKWLMVTNTLWVVDSSLIMFVLGRIVGARGIGLYQIANQIGSLPASEIGAPIRDPAAAGYARVCNAPDLMRQSYLENLGLMVAMVMPLSVGIAIMAEPVTQIFLGAQWSAATPLVAYCAFFALFDAIAHFPAALYIILDRQKSLCAVLGATLIIRVPLVILAAQHGGILGAMAAFTVSAFLNMFIWHRFAPAIVDLRAGGILRETWRTVLSSGAMAWAVSFLIQLFPVSSPVPALLRFFAIVLAGGAVLIAVQFSLWLACGRPHAAESMALGLVRKLLRRLRPSPQPG